MSAAALFHRQSASGALDVLSVLVVRCSERTGRAVRRPCHERVDHAAVWGRRRSRMPIVRQATCCVQDEITSRIAVALHIEMVGAEAARPTQRPDALDYFLRGRAVM